LRVITDKLLEPAPGPLRAKLEALREFAVSRLPKIRELLARPENVQEAHEELAECAGRLTLEATRENGKKRYLPHGASRHGGGRPGFAKSLAAEILEEPCPGSHVSLMYFAATA
jgi:hypothetical protein